MKFRMLALGGFALMLTASTPLRADDRATAVTPSLVGTWTLSAADDLRADGTRVPAYGTGPKGILFLGADGRYSVQIYRATRPRFASGDKRRGTADEYRDATIGVSAHFGRYAVDPVAKTITFRIECASFPNWDGAEQKRPYTVDGDELSWRVPATPDGTIPISVWRRAR
ncbi:lipocalin-like domain-containing protein [Pendulispora albinea]|uniref:Lipocalin-like domain-containing protein n=1 Tax=Pendulispora albinea TaxID=2741071 RepID=A0ABZ2M763_9BACT